MFVLFSLINNWSSINYFYNFCKLPFTIIQISFFVLSKINWIVNKYCFIRYLPFTRFFWQMCIFIWIKIIVYSLKSNLNGTLQMIFAFFNIEYKMQLVWYNDYWDYWHYHFQYCLACKSLQLLLFTSNCRTNAFCNWKVVLVFPYK
jgi:hypothetical protein